MSLTIERGTPADAQEMERLFDELNDRLALGGPGPGWRKGVYPTREHAEADAREGTLYVARLDGRIVGAVALGGEPEPADAPWPTAVPDGDALAVHRFVVHPDYHRRGIGSALLDFADALAKERGKRTIRLDTYEHNAPAIGMYEKHGYAFVGMYDLGLGQYGLHWFRLYEKPVG